MPASGLHSRLTANYFFVESFVVVVVVDVDILLVVSAPILLVVSTEGVRWLLSALIVVVVVVEALSFVDVVSPVLLQATNAPAIAKMPKNFFMCCLNFEWF